MTDSIGCPIYRSDSLCVSFKYINEISMWTLCVSSAGLHVRSMARLGHPHVPVPRPPPPFLELPHRQVIASPNPLSHQNLILKEQSSPKWKLMLHLRYPLLMESLVAFARSQSISRENPTDIKNCSLFAEYVIYFAFSVLHTKFSLCLKPPDDPN